MNLNKKLLVVVGVIAMLILAVLGIFVNRRSTPYIKETVDKDTGDVIYTEPNKDPESESQSSDIILLGSDKLLYSGLTQGQFELAKSALLEYAKNQLHGEYSVIKIPDADYKTETGMVYAKLKLGETKNVLDLNIHYYKLIYVRITLKDPDGNSGLNFDSGQLEVTQPTEEEEEVEPID